MSDWVEKPLAKLIYPLESGKRPAGGVSSETEGVPSLGGENIDVTGKMSYSNVNRISPTYARLMSKGKLKTGDTLINKDGAQTGKVAQYDGAFPEAWINEHVFIVRADQGKIHPDYLFYTMLDGRAQGQITRRITGSAQPGLNSDFANAVMVSLPQSTDAQAKIGQILRALDTQIEATEGLIAKQEQVRAGLMRDLFTRGMDEHGQLRPPRHQAPHLYHQTELGWLPVGWDAPELESMLAPVPTPMRSGPFGSALLKHELVDSGVPFLGIDNIHVEQFKSDFCRFVTPRKFSELSRYRVLPDDVVITIMGTVGRSCVIPYGLGEMLSSKHLWTMSFDQSKVLPKLVCWQLNFAPWVQTWFRAKSQGGIMDAIQSSTLKQLRLPTPPMPEQIQILGIYEVATSHLGQMRRELAKLRLQKSGLMQDLLTGTVPVAPLLEAVPA